MNRFCSFLFVAMLLFLAAGCGHSHEDISPRAAALCDSVWDARYRNVALLDSLSAELNAEAGGNNELRMVATNAAAYAAMMEMDYHRAFSLYEKVVSESECEIERLIADVGMMTISYRVSENRLFFDHRASAISRIRRIDEEENLLSDADRLRFMRARIEFCIVSICYFSNLGMQEDKVTALGYLEKDAEPVDDMALRLYARMILVNNGVGTDNRLKSLSNGISIADDYGYVWLGANYRLLLAISLRDSAVLAKFKAEYPQHYAAFNIKELPDDEFAAYLANDAAEGFLLYGDRYMAIEALSVSASCDIENGHYDYASGALSRAVGMINDYYKKYYPEEEALAENFMDNPDNIVIDGSGNIKTEGNGKVYFISECLLTVRKELSAYFAAIENHYMSGLNRDAYLSLLRTTRQNKNFESRFSMAEEDASNLDYAIVFSALLLVAALVAAMMWHRKRMKHRRLYSGNLRMLQVTCKNLLSSLPRDVESKEDLCGRISSFLNCRLGDYAGETVFSLLTPPEMKEGASLYEFPLHYVNGDKDCLYVMTERPLLKEKLAVISMLVPYVAVAVEEGMRLSHIRDEKERVEEELAAYSIHLEEQKRENLLKRVSVSVVVGMRPFMDRIIHELEALSVPMEAADEERKLRYVEELTCKLDDLNVILERWIKMRRGELNLQVGNFMLSDIFSIVEKSRMLLERKGIELVVDESAAVVKADKALTLFMVNTLVDNASKFTPQGGTITVGGREGEGYVEISVEDTGIGMSQSDIDRILGEKVYDASSIGKDNELLPAKSKGSGFGLMNCKGIIDKYRKTDGIFSICSMDIESTKGKGSRFSFRLPKGVMRLVLLLLMMMPFSVSAADDALLDGVKSYADSVYFSNVNGDYEASICHAGNALRLLNAYYREHTGGVDTLSLSSGAPNELKWWQEGLFPENLYEDIYVNIIDIRNEVSIASLALKRWQMYRYNNHIHNTLYRMVNEEKNVAERYEAMRANISYRNAALALILFMLVITVLYMLVSYLNHSIIGKKNERMALDVNRALLKATSVRERLSSKELLQRFVDTIYDSLGEGMRIKSVSIMLCRDNDGNCVVATSGGDTSQYGSNVFLSGVVGSGEPYLSPDALIRVLPLSVAAADGSVMVGAMQMECIRPLVDDEVLNIELMADYAASVIHHSIVRVAGSYMALDEMEEAAERMRFEENSLHVQNMVLDNCLSVIKHETVYYPSRIRELAGQALAATDSRKGNIASMQEYMTYYNTIFGILSNCAKRELDDGAFSVTSVTLDSLFADLSQYVAKRIRKTGSGVELVCEPTVLTVSVDRDMVAYLLELLADAALKVDRPGKLMLRAVDAGDSVRVELHDARQELTSEEAADLFVPTRRNISRDGGICGMEYLVAKEVIRLHEDRTGRRGSRIEARTDAGGTVILFTLPK